MRVKAAVLKQYGAELEIEALDLDEPQDGEILVRLVAAGVSRGDLDAIAGRSSMPVPFVPGSEAAGFVERVGANVSSPEPGDAVLIGWSACGSCPQCRAGDQRRCDCFATLNLSGRRADGSTPFQAGTTGVFGFFHGQSAFATHLLCRATDAIVVHADVPLELMAALSGEFLTGAAAILQLPEARPSAAIVVAGADLVGLAACMVAKARGYELVIVADPDGTRRNLALEVGATIAVPADDGLAAVVRSLAADGAIFALDTTGSAAGREACIASLAPNGVLAVIRAPSTTADDAKADDAGVTIISADDGIVASRLVPQLLALQADGALPIEKLIDFFPFEHVNDAIAAAVSGTCVKPVLRFSLGSFGDLDRAKHEGAATDEASGGSASEPDSEDDDSERASAPEVSA